MEFVVVNKKFLSFVRIWIAAACFGTLLGAAPAGAFLWGGDGSLVTIDGVEFTPEDYLSWWKEWREPEMPLPETPEAFVEWNLLVQEAERMELHDHPEVKRKVEVFLKVRALMNLRYEEVYQKRTDVTDADLRPYYDGVYSPQVNLHLLALKNADQVEIVRRALEKGISLGDAAKMTGLADAEHQMQETGLMRPSKIPEPIREVVLGLETDQAGGPVLYNGVWYFMQVREKVEGTREDFEARRSELSHKFSKIEEARLTRELVERLKKKYPYRIDQDLFDRIGPDGVSSTDAGKIVVQVVDKAVTAEALHQLVAKELGSRSDHRYQGPDFNQIKEQMVYGMVEQTLLGREALARNYQEREPLKSTYQFYRRYRMVKELEKDLILPQVSVTEADIRTEYEDNPGKYLRSPGSLVEFARVESDDPKLAEILDGRLRSGEAYEEVMKVLSPGAIPVRQIPTGHLEPEIAAALDKLAPGQAGSGVVLGEKTVFVKLLKRVEKDVFPLEKVADSIRRQLTEESFQSARRQVLEQLRGYSEIKVNQKAWKKLRKRLAEQTDES